MAHYTVNLERIAVSDHKSFRGGELKGGELPLEIEIKIHPTSSGVIVVNYPGHTWVTRRV